MVNFFQDILIKKRSLLRLIFFVFFDAILIIASVYLAFSVRFEGNIPGRYLLNIGGVMLLSLLITIPVLYFAKLYYFSWTYVSAAELVSLIKATALSFLILAAAFFVLRDHAIFTGFPRSTLFITYFFIFIFTGGLRFAKRIYFEAFSGRRNEKKERTLIVGAGDAGEQILRSIQGSRISPYLPVGFIDDHPAKQGVLIHNVKVLGKISDVPAIVKEKQIAGLIIALPSAGSKVIMEAVESGRMAGLRKIKIVPPINEIIAGRISLGTLREVEMEDLLNREPLSLDKKLIEGFIKNKKVLVTGAAGSIGSELCRQIIKFQPAQLFLLDQDETGIFNIENELKASLIPISSFVANIRDKEAVDHIFSAQSPQVVFHAAAYKHVPLMEEHPDEAIKNNVLGTAAVASAALKFGAEKFIFVSTDKAVNPVSIMGATKRLGEMICQTLKNNRTKFISVRFGNVLDSRGSVIPIFREQIRRRGPVEITHPEMKRYFMTTAEACLLVLQAGAMGQGGEVFVLDMGKPIKIVDLAREMIRLSGLEPDKDVPIVYTQPRPGEKFFEDILTSEEGTTATENQKIFMAKLSPIDKEKLDLGLLALSKAAEIDDKENIVKILKELILNYKPVKL